MNINKTDYVKNLQASLKIVQSNVNAYFAKDGNADKTMDDYFASDDFYAIIDAVNIDWNGIEVSENKKINTTAELINWIKEIATSIPEQGGSQDEQGTPGQDGKSAYEIAQENGFEGTEEEWLESLKGTNGENGANGKDGKDGKDGKSAYELYKDNFVTEPDKVLIIDHTNFSDAVPAELKDYYTNYPNEAAGDGDTWPPYNAAMFPWLYVGYNFDGKTTIKVYYKGEEKLTWKPSAQIEQVDANGQGTGNMVDRTYGIIGLPGDLGLDMFTESNDGNEILANIEDFKVELIKDELLSEVEWLASLKGKDGSFDDSALELYATKEYVGDRIAEVIGEAPETLDTLKEIADKLSNDDTALGQLTTALNSKANVEDVYTKNEANVAFQPAGEYLTEHQDISGKANTTDVYTKDEVDAAFQPVGEYLTEHQSLSDYATKEFVGDKITEIIGEAPEALDTLKEIADQLNNDESAVSALTLAVSGKANAEDVYNKDEANATFQPVGEYLTEHQDLSDYATKEYVDNSIQTIVGTAPQNFDTIEELASVMDGLKVVDVEAVEPVEGIHWTQEEIEAAQEGDEAYGKTTDDWKVEPVEGVEEQSHNMTISEFVTSSMEAVDEKAAVAKVQAKYEALLTLLNIRESQVNSIIVNQELEESNNVAFDEPVDNIVIPETTAVYVVTGPLEDDATVTLTSNKYMTLDNTSEEPVSATVQRPAEVGETGTSGTTVYLVGQYDTLTLENVSPNVKSGRDAAVVNNVVITENNTKNLTLNLDLQDGATITNNSATAVTINDKNNAETVLAIVAPNSTVTLNGGTYTTLDASVSDNTLVIKKNAHIGTLNVTKGNVMVEVPRESDIANIIGTLNIAEGYSVDYLHDDITASNISKLTTTGTHTFQEDLTKSGNFSVGLFSNDDMIWNLNGHNLTSSNTRGYGIFTLRGTAQLEINDTVGTGVVKNTADEYGFWTSTVGSKVIINGGNFEAATHVLYAQKGTIEVNGGTFKLTDAATADKDQNGNFKFLLNCHDEDYVSGDAKIIVRGGKFYGFDPSNTYGEPGGPVNYVAAGYESVPTNEVYEYGTVYEVRPIQA